MNVTDLQPLLIILEKEIDGNVYTGVGLAAVIIDNIRCGSCPVYMEHSVSFICQQERTVHLYFRSVCKSIEAGIRALDRKKYVFKGEDVWENIQKQEGCCMSDNKENNKSLREVERDMQEEKKNQSIADQSRVPNEQNRLKDQENLRR